MVYFFYKIYATELNCNKTQKILRISHLFKTTVPSYLQNADLL